MSAFRTVCITLPLLLCLTLYLGCNNNSSDENVQPQNGSTFNGYFFIAEPGGNVEHKIGNLDTVRWSSFNTIKGSSVSISLYNDKQFKSNITTVSAIAGFYTYYIPNTGTGNKYHIKINGLVDTTQYDFGSYYTISSGFTGSYTIDNPTDSSVWAAGNNYSIQWKTTGSPGTYVIIHLCRDSVFSSVISSMVSNSGSYSWSIPGTITTDSGYRVKIASYSDSGISAYSKKFIINGMNVDVYEPDNIRDSASAITFGTVQQHTITLNDTDWVKFTADSGGQYIIQDIGNAGFRTYLYLYYGGETSPTATNYTNSSGTLQWYWPCPRNGTFFTRITSYSSGALGSYSFKVTRYDSSTAATFSSPIATTTWASGSSSPYTISWTPDTSLFGTSVYLNLYKGKQNVLSIASGISNSGAYSWYIPAGLITASDYRIRIANYSNSLIYGYSAFFTISGIAPDTFEFDNIRDSARTAVFGAAQQHTITFNDTDWVRFSGDSGKQYNFQINTGAFTVNPTRVYFYLYYGTETASTYYGYSSTSGLFFYLFTCAKNGNWYVKMFPYSSSYMGNYAFKVSKYDSLNAVTFSSPISATNWSAGSTYSIAWTPDSGLLGTTVTIDLFKDKQRVLAITSGSSNSGSYSWSIPAGLGTAADYRIRIANYSTVSIAGYSAYFTISGMPPDAFEFDNIRDSASTATPGTAQQHTMTLNDTDWVRVSADSGKQYLYQVNTGAFTTYPTRVYFYMYYGTETSIFYSSYSSSTGILAYPMSCPKSGVWYIKMWPYSTIYTGNYSFKVMKYDSSTAVTFTNPTASSNWSAGSSYSITWIPDTTLLGTSVSLGLYRAKQLLTSITSATSNTGSYSWSVPSGFATDSNYRIKLANYSLSQIYGYSQNFTISGILQDAFEYDDSAGSAKTIATNGTVQNRTLPKNDIDWISFTAEKDSIYVIQASGDAGLYMSEYLYFSPSGSTLMSQTNLVAPKIVWTCPQSGTYYVKIFPYSSSYYGTYRLSVKKFASTSIITFINPTSSSAWSTGSSYSIQWVADTALFGMSVRIQLAIDTTVLLSITSSATNNGTYSWTPVTGLPSGSKYRIKISNYSYPNIYGFSQAFTISGIDPDAYEPDDSAAIAHTIPATGSAENHSCPLYDRDWYKFTATDNLLYVIKSNGAIKPAIYFYSTDAKTLLASANTSFADTTASIAWFCPVAGTYYFRDTCLLYGTYQTTVSSYDSTIYKMTITSPHAGDTFTVSQTCVIQWTNAVSIGGYVDIFLYNSAGIVSTVIANTNNNGSYSWTIGAAVVPDNTYYVKVISRVNAKISGNSGVFTIK